MRSRKTDVQIKVEFRVIGHESQGARSEPPDFQGGFSKYPFSVGCAESAEVIHWHAQGIVIAFAPAHGRVIAAPHDALRAKGFDSHIGEWGDGVKGHGHGTELAESGEFDGQIRVFGEREDFFERVIGRLLAFANAREVFDCDRQIRKFFDHLCKLIAQEALGVARRADDEVELRCYAPLCERIGAIGAAVCRQANAHDALLCPSAHGRAIVCWGDDHRRLKFPRMRRHAVEHVLIIRISRVLDENGFIDFGCIHVVEQGFHGFVFVQANVAMGIDNGHNGLQRDRLKDERDRRDN